MLSARLKTLPPLLACTALGAAGSLSAAPTLKFGGDGVVAENGPLKCTLAFPLPINAAKAKAAIAEKSISGTTATLTYQGGGKIEVNLLDGEVALKLSGMPADLATLNFTMSFDNSAVTNGQWRFDETAGAFPAEKAGGQIHQGNFSTFAAIPATGPGIAFTLPAASYQQLMDLRQFQRQAFFWQAWLPVSSAATSVSIRIGDAAGGAAPPATGTPAPKVTEAKPEPDRQTYGQLGGIPPEQKSGTRILKWKDGRQAAFLLGFDDSSPTHLAIVIPELEKRRMIGNFYINPGGTLFKQKQAQWEQAAKSPYVALHNHTYLHNGTQNAAEFEADLVKTSDAIRAMTPHLKEPRLLAFRTPGGVPWKISKTELTAVLAKYHMVDRPWLDGPPLTMKTLPPVLAAVDTALGNGGTGFIDFHGVGGDANVAPTEWFIALLDKLDEHRGQFWITDTVSWFQYQDERRKSELKVSSAGATQVRASLTCSLDPVYYNLPLTLAVEVPVAWKECTVTQGGKTTQAVAANGEVRFDALPGADEIVIKGR